VSEEQPGGVRALYRPGIEPPGRGGGAPSGPGRPAQDARRELLEFLDFTLMRPLYFNDSQRAEQLEQALTTMTPADRVFIEIEMLQRKGTLYSSDYDPLR
jgi:hypothetical protein